VLLLLKLR